MTLQFINQPMCVILSMVPSVLFRELWSHRKICLSWGWSAAKKGCWLYRRPTVFFQLSFKQLAVVCAASLAREQRAQCFV